MLFRYVQPDAMHPVATGPAFTEVKGQEIIRAKTDDNTFIAGASCHGNGADSIPVVNNWLVTSARQCKDWHQMH